MKSFMILLTIPSVLLVSSAQAQIAPPMDQFTAAQYVAAVVLIGREHCDAGSSNDEALSEYLQKKGFSVDDVSKGAFYRRVVDQIWPFIINENGKKKSCEGLIQEFKQSKLTDVGAFFQK